MNDLGRLEIESKETQIEIAHITQRVSKRKCRILKQSIKNQTKFAGQNALRAIRYRWSYIM